MIICWVYDGWRSTFLSTLSTHTNIYLHTCLQISIYNLYFRNWALLRCFYTRYLHEKAVWAQYALVFCMSILSRLIVVNLNNDIALARLSCSIGNLLNRHTIGSGYGPLLLQQDGICKRIDLGLKCKGKSLRKTMLQH